MALLIRQVVVHHSSSSVQVANGLGALLIFAAFCWLLRVERNRTEADSDQRARQLMASIKLQAALAQRKADKASAPDDS